MGDMYKHATSGTTLVTATEADLVALTVNTAVAGLVINLYDGQDDTGVEIAEITLPVPLLESVAAMGFGPRGIRCPDGIAVKLSAAADITVVWR